MSMATEKRTPETPSKAPESVVERTETKSDTETYVLGERDLRKGDRGEDVARLQRNLNLNPTGIYNEETEKKVKFLQRIKSLKETGSVDSDFVKIFKF